MSKPLRIGQLLSVESISSIRISSELDFLLQLIFVDLSVMLLHELLIEHHLPQLANLQACNPSL